MSIRLWLHHTNFAVDDGSRHCGRCKGQYTSLQNMMLEQNRTGNSFNVVQRLVDLFEALQPLISLSLAHDNGDIALLAIQLLDTLKELLMGPNEKNQR